MSRRKRFGKEPEEEHIGESWLIPYADILTLLLALFIVLFAASNIDKEKYQEIMESFQYELVGPNTGGGEATGGSGGGGYSAPSLHRPPLGKESNVVVDPELADLGKRLEHYISANSLRGFVSLEETKRGVEVTLQEFVLFDSAKADLKPDSYETLKGLLGIINDIDNPISIEGHTDNVPINTQKFPTNWELSTARAASVLHFFIENGIEPTRLQIIGFGEYHPLKPNDTAENRQINRRVTIAILKNDDGT